MKDQDCMFYDNTNTYENVAFGVLAAVQLYLLVMVIYNIRIIYLQKQLNKRFNPNYLYVINIFFIINILSTILPNAHFSNSDRQPTCHAKLLETGSTCPLYFEDIKRKNAIAPNQENLIHFSCIMPSQTTQNWRQIIITLPGSPPKKKQINFYRGNSATNAPHIFTKVRLSNYGISYLLDNSRPPCTYKSKIPEPECPSIYRLAFSYQFLQELNIVIFVIIFSIVTNIW